LRLWPQPGFRPVEQISTIGTSINPGKDCWLSKASEVSFGLLLGAELFVQLFELYYGPVAKYKQAMANKFLALTPNWPLKVFVASTIARFWIMVARARIVLCTDQKWRRASTSVLSQRHKVAPLISSNQALRNNVLADFLNREPRQWEPQGCKEPERRDWGKSGPYATRWQSDAAYPAQTP
jgi:hypothetical protein